MGRLPRPFGVTSLMQDYHKTGNPDTLDKIKELIIQNWLLHGSTFAGIKLNLYELSTLLGSHPSYVHNYLSKQMLGSKLFNKENQNEMIEQLMSQQIAWTLEDRIEIQNQVDLLLKSQGTNYKPFISAEVTKALGLKLSSTNALASLVKGVQGGGSINIFNQQNNNIKNEGLSITQAIELISESQVNNPVRIMDAIEVEYDYSDKEAFPEVVATRQNGLDTEKEGLTLRKAELTKAIDDYKGALEDSDETHHQLRREIEYRIDQDEDDPEFEKY